MPDWGEPIDLNGGMISPVTGTVGSGFNDSRSGGARTHHSYDIAAPSGAPVVAPSDMTLIARGQGGSNLNSNDHWAWFRDNKSGLEYRFAHNAGDVMKLEPGAVIKQGEQWDRVGGAIKGTHLHMMMRNANGPVDWGSAANLTRGTKLKGGGWLESLSNFIGPSRAEAAEVDGHWGKPIDTTNPQNWGEPIEKEKWGEPTSQDTKTLGQRVAGTVTGAMSTKLPLIDMSAGELGALGVGGAAGGALGAMAGGVGAIPGAVAGAGLMYGAEQQAEKAYRGEKSEGITQASKGAAKDVATGSFLQMTGMAAEPILKPVADWVGSKLKGIPSKLYESAMKIPPSVDKDIRDKAVKTALEGNYSISKSGLERLAQEKQVLNDQVAGLIDDAAAQGKNIQLRDVFKRFDDLKNYYADMADPQPFWEVIDNAKRAIADYRGTEIPVEVAQRIKQRTYQQLSKAYGELKSVDKETNKALARGIKEELENQIPELKEVNKALSDRINLETFLERAVNRVRNYETIRLGDMILGVGGAAGTKSLEGGFYTALVNHVLNNPGVISRIAILLNKSGNPTAAQRLMGYALGKKMIPEQENKQIREEFDKINQELKRRSNEKSAD